MRVMEGESFTRIGDGKWIKIELELEESDLLGILMDWGSKDPAGLRARLSTPAAYDILSVQAQLLIALRAYSAGGMTAEEFSIIKTKLSNRIVKRRTTLGLQSAE